LAASIAALPAMASAATYTYVYTGPKFANTTDNLSIYVTTPSALAPSTVYTTLPNGAYGTFDIHAGANSFSMPLQPNGFFVNTDAKGNIASWYIVSDVNTLTSATPMSGRDYQVYSMDTLSPAVPIPGGVTGRYSYDQGSIVDFFASCAGIAGCTLAGSRQPYVYLFGENSIPAGGGVGTGIWQQGFWTKVVNNPGTATCEKETGDITSAQGKITAKGPGYVVINRVTITYNACTNYALNNASKVRVGMKATYKAIGNKGTVMATDLSIN